MLIKINVCKIKSMKNKKLIGFLIVLIFLTVLIVLNSTLFTLQKISVNWLTTKYNLESVKDYTLVDGIEKGESIFLVKKNEIASQLEKKYPYIRVVSIETKFPNQIVIHSAERESMFAIKISDDNYAVCDELGKVLSRSGSGIFAGSDLGAKPIKVILNSVSLSSDDMQAGTQIQNEEIVNILTKLSKSLRESNYTPTTSKGIFTSLEIKSTGNNAELYFKTRNGMSILLKEAMDYTTDKCLLALERYNYFHQEGVVSGGIMVWNDDSNKIYAVYEDQTEWEKLTGI